VLAAARLIDGAVLGRLFAISRPVLWVNTLGPALLGLWLTGDLWRWDFVPLLLWLTLPFNLLIYGVNDISDQEVDALSARKGSFEGARIDAGEVAPIAVGVLALNAPFAMWFAWRLPAAALGWMAAYALVFVLYSLRPIRFKGRPFLDGLSNTAYAFPLVFVPLAFGAEPIWPAALGLMMWAVAKHGYDAIQDLDEDRAAGVRTTVVAVGVRGALVWCSAWWLASTVAFWLVSPWVAVVSGGFAAALIVGVAARPTPARAHALYRVSIAYPYVAGGFAGVLLASSLTLAALG